MFLTLTYKNYYVHFSIQKGVETIKVQTPDYKLHKVKSYHAAKLLITKLGKGL